MRKILLLFVFLNTLICFAQSNKIQFEYNKQIVSGKLKTSLNNLRDYIVVKSDNNEEQNFNIAQIKDIVINKESFVAVKVLNDDSLTKNIASLNHLSEPNYKENWLLLKVLVKGDYNLYQYSSNNFSQFYYQDKNTSEIKPLIHKQYIVGAFLKNNNRFRSQLRQELPLYYFVLKDYEKLEYKYDDLLRYFNKLNGYEEDQGIKKMNLKVSVFAGYLINDLKGKRYHSDISIFGFALTDYQLEQKSDLFFGFGGEIMLDKKELNAIFLEAAFSKYSTSYYLDSYSSELSKIDFRFKTNILLFNLGYKRYFNLSLNSQVYVSGSMSANFFNTSKNYTNYHWFRSWTDHLGEYHEAGSYEILQGRKKFSDLGGRIALGYRFKRHYFIEANYRSAFNSENTGFKYNVTSFIAGYTF